MAIVSRKLKKGGSSYYVVLTWAGKDIWRRIGRNKREAEDKEREWRQQIKDGTYSPDRAIPVDPKVREYIPAWLKMRTNRTAEKDDSMMRLHVLSHQIANLYMRQVRPRHVIQLLNELRLKGPSDKRNSNALGTLRAAFADAKRDEYTSTQPVDLPKRTLKRDRAKEPEMYQPAECRVLMTNQNLDARIRMLWTLLFCTGMREGEAVGRKWGDLKEADGLHALHINPQYDGQPLKTDRPRVVPIHPVLAQALFAWRHTWKMLQGREPRDEDFIVPGMAKPMMTRSSAYKWLKRSCETVKVPWKSLHSTRHTFITLANRGGADRQSLEKITHNAKGGIIDGYTRQDWAPLCEAVRAVSFDENLRVALPGPNQGKNPFLGSGGNGHMEAPTIANNGLTGDGWAGFDSPRLHPKHLQNSGTPEPAQIEHQGHRGAASSMVPALQLAAVASELGILPARVVTESGVRLRAAEMRGVL